MSQDKVMEIFNRAVYIMLELAAPVLIIAMAIGLIIAIFQAATQIHEQTLTFAPKAIGIALVILALGPWMINILIDFSTEIFELMVEIGLS